MLNVTKQMLDAAHEAEYNYYSKHQTDWGELIKCSARPVLVDIIIAVMKTAIEQKIVQETKPASGEVQ